MSSEKIKKLNDILTTQYGHLNIEAFNQIQDLYAKQSKQDEVKYCWASNCNGRIIDGSCENCDPKPQPQVKEQPKGRVDEFVMDKFNVGENQFKVEDLILSASDISNCIKEFTLQDNGLREAAEDAKETLGVLISMGMDADTVKSSYELLEKALK